MGGYIDRWEALIQAAQVSQTELKKLTGVLRADDEEILFFKGFDPFPGVLSAQEKAIHMRVEALKHLAAAAAAMAPDTTILVFGSASAFASYPELREVCDLYKLSRPKMPI